MADNFKDLAAFEDPNLHLIYDKTHYVIKAASFSLGRHLHKVYKDGIAAAEAQRKGIELEDDTLGKMDDEEEGAFIMRCLGEELIDKLEADEVPYKVMSLMAMTLLFDTVSGREMAQAYWAAGGKAQPQKKGQKTATPTQKAAGTTTRKQGSASTTKTAKAKAAGTSGQSSSDTGKS